MNKSLLSVAAILAGFAAQAAGVWTTGGWSSLAQVNNNLARPRYLSTNVYSDYRICDGLGGAFEYGNGRVFSWKFPRKATISGVNIYSQWKDSGRDDLRIGSIGVRYEENGAWTTLENSAVSYTGGANYRNFGGFADENGAPLAENVVELRVVLANPQENNGGGYAEIQVLGELEPGDPDPEEELEWVTGAFDPNTWHSAGESNMMNYCSSMLRNGSTAASGYSKLLDGAVPQDGSGPWMGSGVTFTWNFAKAFDLQEFRVFSRWGDTGRSAIGIFSLEVKDEDGVWTRLTDAENRALRTNAGCNYAFLHRKDGELLATGVTGIRVLTDYHNADAWWTEVEAVGEMVKAGAIFDDLSVRTSNDCWQVFWTSKVSSLGASPSATLNLWTSLDNVNYTLGDSTTVTAIETPVVLSQTFDDVNLTRQPLAIATLAA